MNPDIIGSCDCFTKTPDITYHKPDCKYRMIVERDQFRAELAAVKGALGDDNAGRPFEELLRTAADMLLSYGGGPVEDCLRAKADEIAAAQQPNTPQL